ncbi:PGPGW domain-containing protein [Aquisalimonas lutea]|uniref:PGPGW domain-containing protein n=1 Tax=Aquisalimonas lutea TaxID=1327750 RepID=UPI0025B328B5|nr:PGPGW domain-containing protein [Aquisalimonas lutea]MDN3516871.1 PGPGW domain-containing protein [Aquisalimonas lutea]
MPDWLPADPVVFWWLAAFSVVMLLGGVVMVPWIVVRIPADYFAHRRREAVVLTRRHPVVRALLLVTKNLVGAVLIVAGVLMLVLPGQGVLTILVGLTLVNFPGKFRVERWIITRPAVLRSVNWLRQRAGRRPLEV